MMTLEDVINGGSVLPMTRWGDGVMHAATRPVTVFDEDLHTLVRDMFATMKASRGVGLAATQVGVDLAVFTYDCADGNEDRRLGAVCNPVVVLPEGSERSFDVSDEGCLSLPGAFQPLGRPDQAVCSGMDPFGQPVTVVGTGFLSRCLQHETDHLNGIVFGDRLSGRARRDLYEQHRLNAHLYPEDWPRRSPAVAGPAHAGM